MSMTESEKVKKWFDSELSMRPEESLDSVECEEIKDICLNAIEEREQYRAIGTVEQLEWCKDASHWKGLYKEKLEQYEAIGTVSEFRELKEKATAKKPIIKPWTDAKCPSCGGSLSESLGDGYYRHHVLKARCECGQFLDWREGKE